MILYRNVKETYDKTDLLQKVIVKKILFAIDLSVDLKHCKWTQKQPTKGDKQSIFVNDGFSAADSRRTLSITEKINDESSSP